MSEPENTQPTTPSPLLGQLSWFVRLRWIAGAAVILAALLDWRFLGWYGRSGRMLWLGPGILAYNLVLWLVLRPAARKPVKPATLVAMAWGQIFLDLACLAWLTVWTGRLHSPILGFFVFHMVIASLLLPHPTAYGAVAVAAAILLGALVLAGSWPLTRIESTVFAGWLFSLLIVAYMACHISRALAAHRRRVQQQDLRIQEMSDELRRQNRAMIQQEKMAAMGVLAAGVAHEISNPLASLDSLVQLMQRNPDRVRADALDKMKEQIERINETVRQLTHFAHPGEERWEEVSIDRIVDRTLQMVHYDHRLREVRVDVLNDTNGAARVKAQPHAIEQVLVNLILNAVDAMADEPEPRLIIQVGRKDHECHVSIIDNGHGIQPRDLDRIFEPFFTTKPVGKGTGLGLAVSYRLIRTHGGQITAVSDGKGATFTVSLPTVACSQS